MDIDTFIPCLISKAGLLDRCFIDMDDIVNLDKQHTKAGRLRFLYWVAEPDKKRFYRVWIRRADGNHVVERGDFSKTRQHHFYKLIKQRFRDHKLYSQIVIVSYTDATFTQVKFIDHNDFIVKLLANWHSSSLHEWVNSYCDDEFAPKDVAVNPQ